MNTKLVAIVVVIIVVVAAVGVYVVYSGDDEESVEVDASLAIMGNANGDAKIDSSDLEIINDIISGDLDFADYPLADADDSGDITQDDADLVQDMIDHVSGIEIYVICQNSDDSTYTQAITYPLENVVVIGTNLLTTFVVVGASEEVCAYTKTNYGVAHQTIIDHATCLGGSITDLSTDEAITNFQTLDTEVGIDAVVTMPSASYLKTSESYITEAGIPVLRIDSADGMASIAGALTIGFICGEESEEIAYEYAEQSYEVMDYITETVSDIADEDRKTFISITMGYYISGTDSDYNSIGLYAGGISVTEVEGTSQKLSEGDTFYYQWNPDYIFSFRSLDYSIDYTDYSTGTTLTSAETWQKYESYFDMLGDSYYNMIYVNGNMPVICRIAFVAAIFYPDLFGEDYGYEVWQSFVDNFFSYLGDDFDVKTDMTCLITYEDVYGSS